MATKKDAEGRAFGWECDAEGCHYVIYAGRLTDEQYGNLSADHVAQHAPGRVLDIEPDWIVSAVCTGCDEAVDLTVEDESLVCPECGAYWDMRGENGRKDGDDDVRG